MRKPKRRSKPTKNRLRPGEDDGTVVIETAPTRPAEPVSFDKALAEAAAGAKVQLVGDMCTKCGGHPIPTAPRGIAGSARIARLCVPCWRALNGVRSGPAPKRAAGDLGEIAPALDKALQELNELADGISADSAELLERSRRFVHELRGRTQMISAAYAKIEHRSREALAEVRRETKAAYGLRDEMRRAISGLPKVERREDEHAPAAR